MNKARTQIGYCWDCQRHTKYNGQCCLCGKPEQENADISLGTEMADAFDKIISKEPQ